MLPLKSEELAAAAESLSELADEHNEGDRAHVAAWSAVRSTGAAIAAARSFDHRICQQHGETVAEMVEVATVLHSTARTVHAIELDLGRLIALADQMTQNSPDFKLLINDIRGVGQAIDHACALEIEAICTPNPKPAATSLREYANLSQSEIHELVLATAPSEVRTIAQRYPDASLLPAGEGGLILVFGELDTSAAMTTIIPGVGSSNPGDWAGYAQRTEQLARATGGAAALWIDYRAPSSLVAATSTAPASHGAGNLREFQAEVRRRRARAGNEAPIAVLAHSYGTVVAGHAARGPGLDTDALILMGSPGIGANHASEVNIKSDRPRLVATTSPEDPIGLTVGTRYGAHGPDPADPQFGAEVWPAAGDHSGYWADPGFSARLRGVFD